MCKKNLEISSLSIFFVLLILLTNSTFACDKTRLNIAKSDFLALLKIKESGGEVDEKKFQRSAIDYISYNELCFHAKDNNEKALRNFNISNPVTIDDGGLLPNDQVLANKFVLRGYKWGNRRLGTPGGTITYSFMPSAIKLHAGYSGSRYHRIPNSALSSLPGYRSCIKAEIAASFAAWSAVSNINFRLVQDDGKAETDLSTIGKIRIGAHSFGTRTLAHAYYPPSQLSGDPEDGIEGDIHFNTDYDWSCSPRSGRDIGTVALHEIGHSIGLRHSPVVQASMYRLIYNEEKSLHADDIAGAVAIYGNRPSFNPSVLPPIHYLLLEDE